MSDQFANPQFEKTAFLGGLAQMGAAAAGIPGLVQIAGKGVQMLGRGAGVRLGMTGQRFNGTGVRARAAQSVYNAGRRMSAAGRRGESKMEGWLDKDLMGSGLKIDMDASKLPEIAKLPLNILGVNTRRPSAITPQRGLVIAGNALGLKGVVDMVTPKAAPAPTPPDQLQPSLPPGQPQIKYSQALYEASNSPKTKE